MSNRVNRKKASGSDELQKQKFSAQLDMMDQWSYLDKFNSSRWEVTGVNKDVQVVLQQREDAVSNTAAGL